MVTKNLLLELGTEELPPKALRNLAQSLHDSFVKQLNDQGLKFSSSKWYATPRRLALFVEQLLISKKIKKSKSKDLQLKQLLMLMVILQKQLLAGQLQMVSTLKKHRH